MSETKTVYTPGEWCEVVPGTTPKGDYAVLHASGQVEQCRAYRNRFGDMCAKGVTHVCVRGDAWEPPPPPKPAWSHELTSLGHSLAIIADVYGYLHVRHKIKPISKLLGNYGWPYDAYIKKALDALAERPALLAKVKELKTESALHARGRDIEALRTRLSNSQCSGSYTYELLNPIPEGPKQ